MARFHCNVKFRTLYKLHGTFAMNEDLINFEYLLSNISENFSGGSENFITNYSLIEISLCPTLAITYNTSIGIEIAVPEWEAISVTVMLVVIILSTIFGNILVVLGVFTYQPLRIVQNFFIVSLAIADLAVAILVMPLNVAYSILGKWLWGKHLCKLWLTSDILCCTSSILNLCAIAIDRYWAITDPINYANKRTLKRVILQIAGVWILSLIISSPPLLGWNDWPDEFTEDTPCQLTSERGYVLYSSFGSFFIPLIIMTLVYIKIYIAAKQRLRRRMAAKVYRKRSAVNFNDIEIVQEQIEIVQDKDSGNSESNQNDENDSDSSQSLKRCQRKEFVDIKKNLFMPLLLLHDPESRRKLEVEMGIFKNENQTASYSKKVMGSIKRASQKREKRGKPLLAKARGNGDVVHQFIEQKQKISLSKERRAARTLGIIMGVFVICWLPFFLMYVILPFCSLCCPYPKMINFITWLGYINSTVNPLIYTIFNIDFRKAFKKLLYLNI